MAESGSFRVAQGEPRSGVHDGFCEMRSQSLALFAVAWCSGASAARQLSAREMIEQTELIVGHVCELLFRVVL